MQDFIIDIEIRTSSRPEPHLCRHFGAIRHSGPRIELFLHGFELEAYGGGFVEGF